MQDCRFGPEVNADGMPPDFIKNTSERGLAPLRSRPECADIVAALDKRIENALEMHKKTLSPRGDPTDVLCHGDFLRNNILYKNDVRFAVKLCI
jgi:Ser/Thr protein kinase RdoA (MazF antagonist)